MPVNPLEDIKREAEKTREKIAELEKLKEEEKAKQESTSRQRRNVPRDRMIAAQRELLKRQMAWMAEIQERQMRDMADMQRRFLGRVLAGMPFPAFPDMDMGMYNGGFLPGVPPRGLRIAPAALPNLSLAMTARRVVRKTPRRASPSSAACRVPSGSWGFIYEFRSNTPQAEIPPAAETGGGGGLDAWHQDTHTSPRRERGDFPAKSPHSRGTSGWSWRGISRLGR